MNTPTPSLADEISALRAAYAALNRNDIPAFAALLDPQIERVEPTGFPQSGTYHGLDAVTAHFTKARATWAEGACEPKRFIVDPSTKDGDRIVVLVHVRVRLMHETAWREAHLADAFTFRNGKVVQFRTFIDESQALAWAGVTATPQPASVRG